MPHVVRGRVLEPYGDDCRRVRRASPPPPRSRRAGVAAGRAGPGVRPPGRRDHRLPRRSRRPARSRRQRAPEARARVQSSPFSALGRDPRARRTAALPHGVRAGVARGSRSSRRSAATCSTAGAEVRDLQRSRAPGPRVPAPPRARARRQHARRHRRSRSPAVRSPRACTCSSCRRTTCSPAPRSCGRWPRSTPSTRSRSRSRRLLARRRHRDRGRAVPRPVLRQARRLGRRRRDPQRAASTSRPGSTSSPSTPRCRSRCSAARRSPRPTRSRSRRAAAAIDVRLFNQEVCAASRFIYAEGEARTR